MGSYSAFVPAPLPPVLEWTPRLIGGLSDADRLIGRLAGEGGRLPNPHVLTRPFVLLYLSAFFEAARRDYYDSLRSVSVHGAWNEWLEYFLQGVARMSEDALSRATRINDLLAEWHGKLAGHSTNTPIRVLGLLAANPFVTIKGAANQLNLAFTTAQRAIERLESNGILQQVSDAKRDRVYCAQALLKILEEPAQLIASGG